MKRRTMLTLAVVALGTTIAAGTALAQRGAGRVGEAWRVALHRADLTPQQREQVKSVLRAAKPRLEALREQHRASRLALRAVLDAATPDPTAIGQAALKAKTDRLALRDEMRRVRDGALAVLTPEQRARVVGMLDGMRAAARARRG